MITLGIETSCDETSCAILENGNAVRSNIVSSSLARHKLFGGVVPEIASRLCLEAIDTVFVSAIKEAKIKRSDINLIAVTRGPGLPGSLLVGIQFAKSLGFSLNRPVIGVNHLEAHLEANFIHDKAPRSDYLGLIVSGGHTSLVHASRRGFAEIGSTVDDAIGEAYDKVAKILDLGYPGGPVIDKLAQNGNPLQFRLTKPKLDGRFNFSFSGVKTAMRRIVQELRGTKQEYKIKQSDLENLCASFQSSVISWIIEKTFAACDALSLKTIVVGGGVSANSLLRARLVEAGKAKKIRILIPPFALTTDNALMIAKSGYERYRRGEKSFSTLTAKPDLKIGNRSDCA